jgi:hypothetical protein
MTDKASLLEFVIERLQHFPTERLRLTLSHRAVIKLQEDLASETSRETFLVKNIRVDRYSLATFSRRLIPFFIDDQDRPGHGTGMAAGTLRDAIGTNSGFTILFVAEPDRPGASMVETIREGAGDASLLPYNVTARNYVKWLQGKLSENRGADFLRAWDEAVGTSDWDDAIAVSEFADSVIQGNSLAAALRHLPRLIPDSTIDQRDTSDFVDRVRNNAAIYDRIIEGLDIRKDLAKTLEAIVDESKIPDVFELSELVRQDRNNLDMAVVKTTFSAQKRKLGTLRVDAVGGTSAILQRSLAKKHLLLARSDSDTTLRFTYGNGLRPVNEAFAVARQSIGADVKATWDEVDDLVRISGAAPDRWTFCELEIGEDDTLLLGITLHSDPIWEQSALINVLESSFSTGSTALIVGTDPGAEMPVEAVNNADCNITVEPGTPLELDDLSLDRVVNVNSPGGFSIKLVRVEQVEATAEKSEEYQADTFHHALAVAIAVASPLPEKLEIPKFAAIENVATFFGKEITIGDVPSAIKTSEEMIREGHSSSQWTASSVDSQAEPVLSTAHPDIVEWSDYLEARKEYLRTLPPGGLRFANFYKKEIRMAADRYVATFLALCTALNVPGTQFPDAGRALATQDVLIIERPTRRLVLLTTHPLAVAYQALWADTLLAALSGEWKPTRQDATAPQIGDAYPTLWFDNELYIRNGSYSALNPHFTNAKNGTDFPVDEAGKVVSERLAAFYNAHRHIFRKTSSGVELRIAAIGFAEADAPILLLGLERFLQYASDNGVPIPRITVSFAGIGNAIPAEIAAFLRGAGPISGQSRSAFGHELLRNHVRWRTIGIEPSDHFHIALVRQYVAQPTIVAAKADLGGNSVYTGGLFSDVVKVFQPAASGNLSKYRSAAWQNALQLETSLEHTIYAVQRLMHSAQSAMCSQDLIFAREVSLNSRSVASAWNRHAAWVVYLDRQVGIEFFGTAIAEDLNDGCIIDYRSEFQVDQRGAEAITTTRDLEPYKGAIENLGLSGISETDIALTTLNAISGHWALQLIGHSQRDIGEILTCLMCYSNEQARGFFARQSGIIPLVLSLEGYLGATSKLGPTTQRLVKQLGFSGKPISDDLLFLEIHAPTSADDIVRINGRIVEAKFGTSGNDLRKAISQVTNTHELFSKHFCGTIQSSPFRNHNLVNMLAGAAERLAHYGIINRDLLTEVSFFERILPMIGAGKFLATYDHAGCIGEIFHASDSVQAETFVQERVLVRRIKIKSEVPTTDPDPGNSENRAAPAPVLTDDSIVPNPVSSDANKISENTNVVMTKLAADGDAPVVTASFYSSPDPGITRTENARVLAVLALLPIPTDVQANDVRDLANRISLKLTDLGAKIKPINPARARETVTCIQFPIELSRNEQLQNVTKLAPSLTVHLNLVEGLARISFDSRLGELIVEVPKAPADRKVLLLTQCLNAPSYRDPSRKSELLVPFGQEFGGQICVEDLAQLPHLLVGGTTGSGKTVFLQNLVIGLTTRLPSSELILNIIDPKMVDFALFDVLPHIRAGGFVTDAHAGVKLLQNMIKDVEQRFQRLRAERQPNISAYNSLAKEAGAEKMIPMVTIIDEFAELGDQFTKRDQREDFMQTVGRIAQIGRAAGVHLVVATQYPTVEKIPPVVKANLPARVAFKVSQAVNSRVILDESGAETLMGKGDALYSNSGMLRRFQSAYTPADEIKVIVDEIIKLDDNVT